MKFNELSTKILIILVSVCIIYIFYTIFDEYIQEKKKKNQKDPNTYKIFGEELHKKINKIEELDKDERKEIAEVIKNLVTKYSKPISKTKKVTESCFKGAVSGVLMGCMSGGIEDALVGGLMFGVISPISIFIGDLFGYD